MKTAIIALSIALVFPVTCVAQDLTRLSASEAAAKIRKSEITSEAITKALIDKAKAGKSLNAFITLDEAGALKAAKAADAAGKAKKWKGPLHGVPLVIKDNIHVAGLPSTAGTPGMKDFVPTEHAPVVEKLVAAGAVVLGKTNMHELAFGITSNNAAFGAAGNPYDPKRIAGGSSGGNGVAIASRMAPAGLGTDTGGSVRIPSAVNGVSGLRPTIGRYPQKGITPISHTRDTAGPMARSVADLVLLDSVITDAKDAVVPAELKGLRIGVPKSLNEGVEAETERLMADTLAKLKAAGVELVEADIPNLMELNNKLSFPIVLYEVTIDLPAYAKNHGIKLDFKGYADKAASPDVKGLFGALVKGEPPSIPKNVYDEAINVHRPALVKAYADYFSQNKVVAMVFPTVPLPAAPIGDDQETMLDGKKVPTLGTFIRNTDPGSNAGVPGLTVPMGMTKDGLPVGLELDGPRGSDRKLLAIGLALENLLGPILSPK
ncbi:MAG: indoleacetamide hydrolase [Thermodesulfobacteriota bacterium]